MTTQETVKILFKKGIMETNKEIGINNSVLQLTPDTTLKRMPILLFSKINILIIIEIT